MAHLIIAMLSTVVLWASPAAAQTDRHTHEFNALPEVTITGIVEEIRNTGCIGCEACEACSDCCGVHLVLRWRSPLDVHLAPAWFLERQKFLFSPGDAITVTGTRIALPKGRAIVARQVTKRGTVMMFRDEHHLPLWRGVLSER